MKSRCPISDAPDHSCPFGMSNDKCKACPRHRQELTIVDRIIIAVMGILLFGTVILLYLQ